MRVIKVLAPALVAAAALSGCVDGPISSHGGGAVALSLAPEFSFATSAASLPITVVRTTPRFAADGAPAGTPSPASVRADASSWNVYAPIDLGGRDTASVIILIELISTASGGDVVEWSAEIGPIALEADRRPETYDLPVTLLRGPIENAGVESVSVHGPSSMFVDDVSQAYAAVISDGAHSVRWSSSNAGVVRIDEQVGDTVMLAAIGAGTAWISAGAGFHADSFLVHVDDMASGEPAAVTAHPDSAVVVVGATRAWYAFVTDSLGTPIGAAVTWQSLDQSIATVSATGVVTGVSVGRARIVASAGAFADTVIAIVEDLPPGVDLIWQGGTPGAENDWFTADNWSPARVPTASDVVYFPNVVDPVLLDADAEVGAIMGDTMGTAAFELQENVTLTVHGDVRLPYLFGDSTSSLVMAGSPALLRAYALPPLVVRGDVVVDVYAYVYGDVVVENGATLEVRAGEQLVVQGSLTVNGAGLIMTSDVATETASQVYIYQEVVFDGGDSSNRLTGGYLYVGGDFTVPDAGGCTAFRPTDMTVNLVSDSATISMGCAGSEGNRFWNLWIYDAGEAEHRLELATDLHIENELYIGYGTYPLRLVSNGHVVYSTYTDIWAAVFDNTFLEIEAETSDYLYADSLVFTGMTGATRPQLVVNTANGDECAACYNWQNIIFDPASDGAYIELNDLVADGDSVIYYIAHDPGDGAERTLTSGEAAVYWGGTPQYVLHYSGSGQSGPALQPLPDSLIAQVVDYGYEAVAGAVVSWRVTQGDGVLSPATTVSDSLGLAKTEYTMGSVNFPQQEIVATTPGAVDSAFFYVALDAAAAALIAPQTPSRSMLRIAPSETRDRERKVWPQAPARPETRSMLNNGERR